MNRIKAGFVVVMAAFVLSGCSILNPYDSEFSCPGSRDYGKCTNVQGAYSEALGGMTDAEGVSHEKQTKKEKELAEKTRRQALKDSAENRYKEAQYTEMAKLIEMPVTPVITPPKILRTLVVAYATGEKTLYMPRYIFYFATDGAFVLGDYLSAEKSGNSQSIYPNGAR